MRKFWLALIVVMLGLSILSCGSGSSLAFTPTQLPQASSGQPYQVTIVVSGNRTPVFQMNVADGKLPLGLIFTYQENDSSATISGTPQETGQFDFTVSASCLGTNVSGQTGQQVYTLTVK